jgi:hypothetical protein
MGATVEAVAPLVLRNANLSQYMNVHEKELTYYNIRSVYACIRPLYTSDNILKCAIIHGGPSQSTTVQRNGDPNERNRPP